MFGRNFLVVTAASALMAGAGPVAAGAAGPIEANVSPIDVTISSSGVHLGASTPVGEVAMAVSSPQISVPGGPPPIDLPSNPQPLPLSPTPVVLHLCALANSCTTPAPVLGCQPSGGADFSGTKYADGHIEGTWTVSSGMDCTGTGHIAAKPTLSGPGGFSYESHWSECWACQHTLSSGSVSCSNCAGSWTLDAIGNIFTDNYTQAYADAQMSGGHCYVTGSSSLYEATGGRVVVCQEFDTGTLS